MKSCLIGLTALISVCFSLPLFSVEISTNPIPDAKVARAQFTTEVVNREPEDLIVTLENTETSLYYFTELKGLQGRTMIHRWEHGGQVISVIPFKIEGPRWRVFSKKVLNPTMLGKWTVLVVDETGWPLHASIFEYKAAEQGLVSPDNQ